jgi:hypothetical protein
MAEIRTSNGFIVLLDDADVPLVGERGWFADHSTMRQTLYARKWVTRNGRTVRLRMHKLITGYPQTDHINGNGLDNRRVNLRPVSHSQNAMNRGMRSDNTSGFKGVTWDRKGQFWRVRIWVDGRNLVVGRYDDPTQAALAYDEEARRHFGEFARTNFQEEISA